MLVIHEGQEAQGNADYEDLAESKPNLANTNRKRLHKKSIRTLRILAIKKNLIR